MVIPESHHSELSLTLNFVQRFPLKAARILESLDVQDAASILVCLPEKVAARALQYTAPRTASTILGFFPDTMVIDILTHMPIASAVTALRQGGPSWQAKLLGKFDPSKNSALLKTFSYPDNTAGRLADPHVYLFSADRTISDAILWLHRQPHYETDDIFLLTRQQHLLGKVTLRNLLLGDLDSPLEQVMTHHLPVLSADWYLEEILECPCWKESHVLPVLNSFHIFLGVIRFTSFAQMLQPKDSFLSSKPKALLTSWGETTASDPAHAISQSEASSSLDTAQKPTV